jgi:beta-galactosidase
LPVSFDISGGRVIGLGNGDANSHEPEKGNARRIYNGLAQVIVQSEEGGSGLLSLRAHAEGLKPAEAKIAVRPDRGPPRVARPA